MRTSVFSSGGTDVVVRAGEIRLKNAQAFSPDNDRWRSFAARAFSIPATESLEIDRRHGCAVIRYSTAAISPADYMGRFSQSLSTASKSASDAIVPQHAASKCVERFRLSRRGGSLSRFEVVHALPGRLRVRDLGLLDRHGG